MRARTFIISTSINSNLSLHIFSLHSLSPSLTFSLPLFLSPPTRHFSLQQVQSLMPISAAFLWLATCLRPCWSNSVSAVKCLPHSLPSNHLHFLRTDTHALNTSHHYFFSGRQSHGYLRLRYVTMYVCVHAKVQPLRYHANARALCLSLALFLFLTQLVCLPDQAP